jgi:uncharacterized membrane protein
MGVTRAPARRSGGREAALDLRWARTTGGLLVIAGITCAISAVTAHEPGLFAVAFLAEVVGLRCWSSAPLA